MSGPLSLPSLITNGPTIDPRFSAYGALCDWNGTTGTDDTSHFLAAATAANAIYVATGTPVNVLVPKGCVVNGTVTYGSGVHWVGPGTIIVQNQGSPSPHATLMAQNADNVSVENVTVQVVTSCAGNNAACTAIGWQDTNVDSTAHAHAYFRHNTVINSNWGIYATYSSGSGSLTDLSISDNTVSSPSGSYSNADGIHVGGRVSQISIIGNRVNNRNDAGIALTSEGSGTYRVSGATVSTNNLTENRVGLDCSGCTASMFTGNRVSASIASAGNSNPAFREIYYNGYPSGVHVENNFFQNPASVDGSTVKIDPILAGQVSWPSISSTFTDNKIGGSSGILYARGSGVTISGNVFTVTGGGIILDYDGADSVATANVIIGTNLFQSSGVVTFGAGCALYSVINYYPQQTLGALTVSNLPCIGTQTFTTPGDLSIGSGNLSSSGSGFTTVLPGSGAATDFLVRDPTHAINHLIVDSGGNVNVPVGWIQTAQYFKFGGGGTGGIRNASGVTVIPGAADTFHGSSSTHVQMSDGSGTSGNCPKYGADGGLTDSGAPCGSGSGSVTSVGLTVPSWLTVAGTPVTTAGTLGVSAATGQTSHQVIGTCGSATSFAPCALVAADVPTLNQNTTGTAAGLTGTPNVVLGTARATQFQTNAEFCANGGSWPSCTACTTAATINPANGNNQTIILTNAQTCALTLTQPAAGEVVITLTVIQSSAGSFNGLISGCTWPGGSGGGVAPPITPASGAVDEVYIKMDSTHTRCTIAQAFN